MCNGTSKGIVTMNDELTTDTCDVLMEQYKLYVEMADKLSSRKDEANKFYVSLLTGVLALLSIVFSRGSFEIFTAVIILSIGILGLTVCGMWRINIHTYRRLNKVKFQIINEMEQSLPFACYKREWEVMKQDAGGKKYLTPTRVELDIPVLVSIPYLFLSIYALYSLIPK
jgi:hypothetical protein